MEDKILEILKRGKPLKAREIANQLSCTSKEVNSILYGALKSKIVQNNKYQWSIKPASTENPESTSSTDTTIQSHALSMLSNYYLECLSKDYDNGIDEWASGKYGKAYYQLNSIPLNEQPIQVEYEDISSIISKLKKERNGLTVCIGYPLLLSEHTSKKGNPYYKIKPILIQKLDETKFKSLSITPLEEPAYLNAEAIKYLEGLEGNENLNEVISLNEELGINNTEFPEISDITLRLNSIKENWSWQEEIDPDNLSDLDLATIQESGIYNTCAVFVTEKSKYTIGLEKELKDLTLKSEANYSQSVLGKLIKQETQTKTIDERVLIEPLPMNEEQREAILRGLQSDITVVTGPPGTGKSQVVSNLIVNAVKDGQKVLFASKNNKAVDVVLERVNGLSNHPVMLRLGNNQRQSELSKYLTGILSSKVSNSLQARYEEAENIHNNLSSRISDLYHKQEEIVELRNKVDSKEQKIELYRNELGKETFNKFVHISEAFKTELSKTLAILKELKDENNKDKASFFDKLFWSFGKAKRQSNTQHSLGSCKTHFEFLKVPFPETINKDTTYNQVTKLYSNYSTQFNLLLDLSEYKFLLNKLSNASPLFELSKEESELRETISENSNRFWQLWLEILPDRLDREERKVIGDYITVLDLIVRSDEENKSAGSGVWSQYYRLLPKITNILSCWAVTSLSVRSKVPFESCFFDLVIIDEASQCDIASALPLLYRGKRAVIIGDDKQLTHISSINEREDNQLLEKYELTENFLVWSYVSSSLFRLAASLCDKEDIVQLKDHHRSHADIISYSNKYFYNNSLRVATNYDRLNSVDGEAAIRWIDVKGKVTSPIGGGSLNDIEASKVVEEVVRIVNTGYKGTIGVVTPFRAQANRIRDMIFADNSLVEALMNKDFIVDTVHKFQGDERDIMIFSAVVANGISQGSAGFLARNGNLFNVALTRARASLLVVGDHKSCYQSAITHFSQFADHVRMLQEKRESDQSNTTTDFGPQFPQVSSDDVVSDWEKYFYEKLYRKGIKTVPQYKEDKYSLDLALIIGEAKLDIEVDGETYHRAWDGELLRRDKIRNNRLIELGWDVQRFWVYELRDNMDACINKIENWINNQKQ
ncbi:Superfamily I DNA and/or RNA helicase [Maribacter dokdonensis]|uniref:Superfamily I DNA and/or RNA helicase n=1 Tax=Maribacter dokdonensis TaxID=320912 RepID=A0ABY0UF31_9FLAO|nr:AAA domain-containing protein [Maribacter dokdonensis]SDS57714.1 Superfamily I DNA and/or RNA helicase [Maribacter dokdonensis]